jgi:exodeoxyribonuclease VII small subunit
VKLSGLLTTYSAKDIAGRTMSPTRTGKKESFEVSLAQLEKTVTSLEEGNLTLDEAIKAFEKGSQLSKQCEKRLEEARKKIEVLIGNKIESFDNIDKDVDDG